VSAILQYPEIVTTLRERGISMEAFLDTLSMEETDAINGDWDLWKLPYQAMPPGAWRRWIFRAGRGTGKTHTGARTTNEVARDRKKIRTGEIGIIGRTMRETKKVMVEGPTGILATAPADFRPKWYRADGKLIWPNGVVGYTYSADEPSQIRGPNFSWIWGDEPAYWPDLLDYWMYEIEPALRIGWARCMLTTTPRRNPDLMKIEQLDELSVTTRASTYQNPYLKKEVRDVYVNLFAGTRAGRQELEGEYLLENDNALWRLADIEDHRVKEPPCELVRIVVAIDPAVTNEEKSDETGIIVAAKGADGRGYILQDRSMKGSPNQWAKAAIACSIRWKASRIIAEVNNGGDMVETTIRAVDKNASYKAVRASRGKFTRAEPVAALYERGMISHCGPFETLEDQLLNWDPTQKGSPDRLDALVWALHELFLQGKNPAGPLRAYLQ
jgi:phage terminase large subunit-like protein